MHGSRRLLFRSVRCGYLWDLTGATTKIVSDYLKTWAIELLIEDEKQHLRHSTLFRTPDRRYG